MSHPHLVEHFFRHEYGRLVARLSCRISTQHIQAIEDAVQSALITALESWTTTKLPDKPSAWVYRVAYNNILDELRQRSNHLQILEQHAEQLIPEAYEDPSEINDETINDDLLRMLFLCCDASIPVESQRVFALKILCGFNVGEIAHRLFTTEANIYKRLQRARDRFRELELADLSLSDEEYSTRLPAVHKILYLLFTEGHLSLHTEQSIRQELCEEAIRLANILVHRTIGQTPETFALLSLMHLHAARLSSRQNIAGNLLLLEEQDRTQWDQQQIRRGIAWLAESASGKTFSRYHAEAGIAAEHCLAPSFKETRWHKIAEYYALLEQASPSALHRLNRAVAVSEWQGPEAGLTLLEGFKPPSWLSNSYLWSAVLADLHRRCNNLDTANHYHETALKLAPSSAIKELLQRRLLLQTDIS